MTTTTTQHCCFKDVKDIPWANLKSQLNVHVWNTLNFMFPQSHVATSYKEATPTVSTRWWVIITAARETNSQVFSNQPASLFDPSSSSPLYHPPKTPYPLFIQKELSLNCMSKSSINYLAIFMLNTFQILHFPMWNNSSAFSSSNSYLTISPSQYSRSSF